MLTPLQRGALGDIKTCLFYSYYFTKEKHLWERDSFIKLKWRRLKCYSWVAKKDSDLK